MAVSGRRFGGSVKESDFLYDYPCSPCEKDGQNVEAVKFCVDCGENLCVTCIVHHKKFALTRGHKVLDQVQTSQGQTKQLPSQRCSKHGGKIIDVFCPEHDTVGCSTCISVDHSSCKDKKFIPDVAAGIKTSREFKQLEAEMNSLKSKFDSLKKLKEVNIQRLKQDKDDLKKEIQSIRKKMNEELDKMEKDLLAEADTKFKEKIDAIHASIAEVDDMLARLKQNMDQMKSDNNDADIFVSCKVGKREMSEEMFPMHAKVDTAGHGCSLALHIADNAKQIMEGKRRFASIQEKYTIHETEHKEDVDIRLGDDQQLWRIYATCALPDGCLVMSDFNNKKLKKFDPSTNNVSTLITLPDRPVGICLVDNTRLAVSLYNQKKIQFVSVSWNAHLDDSFSVGDRCRGLAYCDGLLYVCCGGNPGKIEGRGHVELYNCTGELLRCLYEECGLPVYIHVINDGYNTTVYTGDFYKGVQVRGIDGAVKHRYQTVLNTELPFCLIDTDQLCIGERSTGNIYLHTYKDKRVLIQKKDLKDELLCLYFDDRSSQLFVSFYNCNIIKVFKLKW